MYVYAGPTASVTTTATQRLSGVASMSIKLASGTSQEADIGMCYTSAGGVITNYTTNYVTTPIYATEHVYSVSATVVPGAGTWTTGACIRNDGGSIAIGPNDYVNGFVHVTN